MTYMKHTLILAAVLFTVILFSFINSKYSLVGSWTNSASDGTPTNEFVTFHEDGTYDVSLPGGQIGERGFYKLKDSILSIRNVKDVCGKDYWGSYAVAFHGQDSI